MQCYYSVSNVFFGQLFSSKAYLKACFKKAQNIQLPFFPCESLLLNTNILNDIAPYLLTFCSSDQSLLLFKFTNFVLNTISDCKLHRVWCSRPVGRILYSKLMYKVTDIHN